MGRTACTDPQCQYSRAIPLLPLWAVRPVQSLSACTAELYLYSPCGLYGLYRISVPVQQSYTSTPPVGRTACTESQCLYSRAIPLLPLWTVRSVQSLSACTVELYLYSPYGPYGLYRASVPVQGCILPLPLPGVKAVLCVRGNIELKWESWRRERVLYSEGTRYKNIFV
jgi:hypothetical protein